jgi:RNA polymerase sigma-70 factor (ECF subfamily)
MIDRQQLERLFRQHYRKMYLLASILLHDDTISRDIVHDVFIRIIENDKPLRENTAEAYLLTSVKNRCLNYFSSLEIQQRAEKGYLAELDNIESSDVQLMEKEFVTLENELQKLQPPQCREVLLMHYQEKKLTFKEIAARLEVSENMVYKYLRSAFKQLREQLKDN